MASHTVNIKCANKLCDTVLVAVCRECDQTLFCPRCKTIFGFLNIASVPCEICRTEVMVPINVARATGRCKNCGIPVEITELDRKNGVVPFRLEEEESVMYCGRGYFEGMEEEVRRAKAAFLRIEREAKSAGLVSKKKAIYFRRIEKETRAPGLKYFQVLHGYCNFKFYSAHEHAKYLGFVAGFADGRIFRELVDERGVSDIWLSDEMLREDLCRFPALARYTKRFRVLS